MLGKNVQAFVLATGWQGALPRLMLEVFFELDSFMDKMEAQWIEREVKKKQKK